MVCAKLHTSTMYIACLSTWICCRFFLFFYIDNNLDDWWGFLFFFSFFFGVDKMINSLCWPSCTTIGWSFRHSFILTFFQLNWNAIFYRIFDEQILYHNNKLMVLQYDWCNNVDSNRHMSFDTNLHAHGMFHLAHIQLSHHLKFKYIPKLKKKKTTQKEIKC